MISQCRIQQLFDYNPVTGRLERKVVGRGEKKITSGVSKQGYLMRWVDKQCCTEHSLVYLFHHGYIPDEIDHANGTKTDNRIENLRECTRSHNNGNHGMHSNNTSGYRGVSWSKCGKWWAQITFNKQHFNLGYYDTAQEASEAYNKASIELFKEFAVICRLNEVTNAYS